MSEIKTLHNAAPVTSVDLQDGPKPFRFVPVGEAANAVKPTDWLIRGHLEADSLALVFGDPGSGKSFVAIDKALCVATATPWHGRKVRQGTVFYIAGEGHNGVAKRFKAWSIARGVDLANAPAFLSTKPIGLTDAENAAIVAQAVDELAEAHGPPRLIVVDTVARNFGGGDENSTQDMGRFIAHVDEWLHHRYRACVLLVHHSGHGQKDRARGASALKAALDAEYRVSRDDDRIVRLEATKMKDAELPQPLAFNLRGVELPITGEDGNPETSAVLDPTDYEPPKKRTAGKLRQNQQLALDTLRKLYDDQRQRLSAAGRDPDSARVEEVRWTEACRQAGMDRRRIPDTKRSLVKKGLAYVEHGFAYLAED